MVHGRGVLLIIIAGFTGAGGVCLEALGVWVRLDLGGV